MKKSELRKIIREEINKDIDFLQGKFNNDDSDYDAALSTYELPNKSYYKTNDAHGNEARILDIYDNGLAGLVLDDISNVWEYRHWDFNGENTSGDAPMVDLHRIDAVEAKEFILNR